MNKSNALSGVLIVAIGVLYVLHFSGERAAVSENEESKQADSTVVSNDVQVIGLNDTANSSIKLASSSKVAYFKMEELIDKSSILLRKNTALENRQERLSRTFEEKNNNLLKWSQGQEQQLQDYANKKMLVESQVATYRQEAAKRQQELQLEYEKAKVSLNNEAIDVASSQNKIIMAALEELNEKAGWDYVLVDNPQYRVVIPFNEKNDITDNLADIINKKHK